MNVSPATLMWMPCRNLDDGAMRAGSCEARNLSEERKMERKKANDGNLLIFLAVSRSSTNLNNKEACLNGVGGINCAPRQNWHLNVQLNLPRTRNFWRPHCAQNICCTWPKNKRIQSWSYYKHVLLSVYSNVS
jgi:hypothetical protein